MNKERRSKSLVIIVLSFTLIALTVGFATFSSTLNISSIATVSPNEEDFKITIYGAKDVTSAVSFYTSHTFTTDTLSSVISHPYIDKAKNSTAEIAAINNNDHTISNISVSLTKPDDEIIYFFVIKNEGKYDAYLDLTEYKYISESAKYIIDPPLIGNCTTTEDTNESLVDEICQNVITLFGIIDASGNIITTGESILNIPKDKQIIITATVGYTDKETLEDGTFTIKFPNIKFNFSLAK